MDMLLDREDNEERFEFICQRFLDSGGNRRSFDLERILNKAVLACVLHKNLLQEERRKRHGNARIDRRDQGKNCKLHLQGMHLLL
jgi:hypothetical protein